MKDYYLYSSEENRKTIQKNSDEEARNSAEDYAQKHPRAKVHLVNSDGVTVFHRLAPVVSVHFYKKGEHARSSDFDSREADALRTAESWANYHPEHYARVQLNTGDLIKEFGPTPKHLQQAKAASKE